jgi:UDP-N-acetyl-alpha-D-muramoyl-L-alanyl-L-glutamate epimerase
MTTQARDADPTAACGTFDAAKFASFACTRLDIDFETGQVEFGYALTGTDPADRITFTEQVVLPVPAGVVSQATRRATVAVLRLAHRVAGVSYFKAAAPATVQLGPSPVTAAELRFLEAIYRDGLHEFAYTNDLASVLDTSVIAAAIDPDTVLAAGTAGGRPLVACGGGKDSIVSLEAMLRSGRRPVSFVVNPNAITRAVVERSGTDLLAATRRLDPALFALNAAGAHNGHVPVTAINSLLAVATGVLHGLGPVVMSNEASASAANLVWHGRAVNHQWSKSLGAERLLRQALASRFGPRELYFSLLRHLNELQIAALFAAQSGYDDVMTSCNRAFTITRTSGVRWCRDCPKCRFVFLALACFMPADRVVALLGGNLLHDSTQLAGYRELLGLGAPKPFECVGELDESIAALVHLGQQPAWRQAPLVQALLAEIEAQAAPVPTLAGVLARRAASLAPAQFVTALDDPR